MGRRSDHTREEIRDLALATAERLLTEQGLAGLSTRAIAKEMGYTSGTLYLAFRNLDDLVLQLNQRTIHKMGEAISGAVKTDASAEDNVRNICRTYVKFGIGHHAQWDLLFQRQWPEGFVYPAWYLAEMGKSLVPFEHELGRMMGPKASPHDVTMAGRAVWCAMQGIYTLYASGRLERLGLSNLDELVEFQINALIKGLLK